MLFNSLVFFAFLPIFLACFFATRGSVRLWVCLVGSYVFYGWWDVRFLGLIAISTLIDFVIARKLDLVSTQSYRRRLIWLSVVSNLGMLFVFKYFNFFRESLVDAASRLGITLDWPTLYIILPVGISFYTFQTLSYTIDVYQRKFRHEPSLLKFAVFVSFFPQLVAGPIVRAVDFLPQLYRDRPLCWRNFATGSVQIAAGFFKKCVIADSLAPYVDSAFDSPVSQSSSTMLLAVLFYAFQIYCDFSGYSDIAIGLAKTMGFSFPQNFNRPYFATSFSEFWQRWHISLSSFLRDYLYIPLGGNRRSAFRTYVNLMLTMLIGGLWHGAAWTFVVWGGLHGAYLVAQRLISPYWGLRVPASTGSISRQSFSVSCFGVATKLVSMMSVFVLVCFAWIFFRSPDFETASEVIRSLSQTNTLRVGAIQNKIIAFKGIALVISLVVCEALSGRLRVKSRALVSPVFFVAYFLVMLCGIAWLGTFGNASFIYFQF